MNKVALLFLLSATAVFYSSANDKYYALVDSAETYIQIKDWASSERFIKDALSLEPDNANNSLLLSNLATVQRFQSKYTEALKNYSFALHMTPNAVTLLQNRASLYMELDSIDKAYNDFERIIDIDPNDNESLYNHGMIALRKNDYNTAKEDFDRILFNNPQSALAREGLGNWNLKNGHYNEAIKFFSEVIKSKPSAVLLSNRAECYLKLNRLNNATDDIRAALELDPDDGYTYFLRAKLNKARFNEEDMLRDLKLAEKYGFDTNSLKVDFK